jgi:hypothetical protein
VIVAGLLDPPADLDLADSSSSSCPRGSRGEMVALDGDGKVLATEPIGPKGPEEPSRNAS